MNISDFTSFRHLRAPPVTLIIGALPKQYLVDPHHLVQPDEINRNLLVQLQPELILSALILGRYDVIDLAEMLSTLGYQGQYRAVCPYLPQPDLVRADVAQQAPDLDFDLWMFNTPRDGD